MKAYESSFQFLPREQWKVMTLPDDVMCLPVVMDCEGVSLNHSDKTGLYYVLVSLEPRTGEDVFCGLITCGHWLDCYDWILNPYSLDVPFVWGQPIKNKYGLTYIPIWETVKTGETIEYDDGWIHEQTKEVYKIIRLSMDTFHFDDGNIHQKNQYSYFETEEYDNLRDMVHELQIVTGIIF